jgi:hypothetical protein
MEFGFRDWFHYEGVYLIADGGDPFPTKRIKGGDGFGAASRREGAAGSEGVIFFAGLDRLENGYSEPMVWA